TVGAGASGRNTGMLSPGVGQSLAALVRRLGRERARRLYAQTLCAVSDVESLIRGEGIDCELAMGGQVIVANSDGARRRLRAQAALLAALELPGALVGDERLLLPTAGVLHPLKLLDGLAERVRRRGGVVHEGARVLAVEPPRRPAEPLRLRL